ALQNLSTKILQFQTDQTPEHFVASKLLATYQKKFLEFINDDLNMPKALALMWQAINDPVLPNQEKHLLILDMDKVFGLDLHKIKTAEIPAEITSLAKERETARQEKNWQLADELRQKIEQAGWLVEDTSTGPKLKKA
ncbi:MAG: hypothetical protein NTZ42_01100, partial [Candidatus Gribaldobacteria bacterium]|nr:hypothetical protein [Candidatus Gribaldobacteria bacterium]